MEEIIELKQLEDSVVNEVRVANARTRPNSTGLYGEKNLSSTEVKEIFDKYPDLLRQKLAEVIDFANALLKIIGNGVEGATITGALNSLSGRVGSDDFDEDSRLEGKTLASAILRLSEDLGAVEASPFSAEYDPENGILRFKTNGNTFASVDLPLESVFVGADYDDENGNLVLTLVNGSKVSIKNDALIAKIEEALFSEELPEAMYNSIVTEGGMKVALSDGKLKFTGGGGCTDGMQYNETANSMLQKDAAPYMKLADGALVEGFVINNPEANKFIKNGTETAIDGKALTSLLVDDNGCKLVCYDTKKDYIGPLVGTAEPSDSFVTEFKYEIGTVVTLGDIQYLPELGQSYSPKEGDCLCVRDRCVTHLNGVWVYMCDDIRYCAFNQATGLNSVSLTGFGYAAGDHAVSLARRGISLGRAGLAEGGDTFVAGAYARAGGANTAAIAPMSSADGNTTTAEGECSSTRGWRTRTTPEAYAGSADGMNTEASAKAARADGDGTKARARASHAGGIGTLADGEGQEVVGKYNKSDTNSLFIVGCGTSNTDRKNVFSVDEDGAYVYDGNEAINLKDSIVSVSYNSSNAVLSFKDARGKEVEVDLPVESLVKDLSVEDDKIVLTLTNGQKVEVSVDAIIDRITEVRKEIIPADVSHIYKDSSNIYFEDNEGKRVSIHLPELTQAIQEQEYYGLVKIRKSALNGLVLSGQYLKIQCAQDLTTTNPTWKDELKAINGIDVKPIVPKWLPLAMSKNIEVEGGLEMSYDPDTWKLKLKGGSGGSGGGKYLHFVHGVTNGIVFSAQYINDSDAAITQLPIYYGESIPATAFIDGVLYTSLYGNPHGSETWDMFAAFKNANGDVFETNDGQWINVTEIMCVPI